MRLYSRPGNDLTYRFLLIVKTVARLRSNSCIIDGDSWQVQGATALDRMATESPALYCRMMASLIPAHFKVEHEHTLLLSEDELRARLLEIRQKLLDSDVDPELLGPPIEEGPESEDRRDKLRKQNR